MTAIHRICGLIALLCAGIAIWVLGSSMDSEAIAMGIGVLLGMIAGIPVALLVIATGNRQHDKPRPPQPIIVLPPATYGQLPERQTYDDGVTERWRQAVRAIGQSPGTQLVTREN